MKSNLIEKIMVVPFTVIVEGRVRGTSTAWELVQHLAGRFRTLHLTRVKYSSNAAVHVGEGFL